MNTWAPNVLSRARKEMQRWELALGPANLSVPTVATSLEEISGGEVEINRENIYSLVSTKKGKNGPGGTSQSHLPQGSLCWDESQEQAQTWRGWGMAESDCLKTVRQSQG